MCQSSQTQGDGFNSAFMYTSHGSLNGDEQNRFDLQSCVSKYIPSERVFSVVDKIEKLIEHERQNNGTAKCYDFEKVNDIKQYCQDRLSEITLINELVPTPSAFVTIAAFLGFLSLLSYGKNKSGGEDSKCFRKFVRNFMSQMGYSPDKMYKTFRCGIVHAMSFYPALRQGRTSAKPKVERAPELLITHSKEIANLTERGNIPVLTAGQLCSDLEKIIEAMFKVERVSKNAINFLSWQPAIVGGRSPDDVDSTVANQISGFYSAP